MIESLYTKYFQKSKSFLYPALGIKRNSQFIPTGTYIALDGLVGPEDMKLVCVFKTDNSEEFKKFEESFLLSNPMYSSRLEINDSNIYLFDFTIYQSDWFNFILGKYSRFSTALKRAIKVYYGEDSSEYKYMDSYLNPRKHFDVYAKLLKIDPQILKEVGELCDPCDLEKETLKIPVELLDTLKKVL